MFPSTGNGGALLVHQQTSLYVQMVPSPQLVGLIGLLALLPVAAFATLSSRLPLLIGSMTAVNVILITISLYHLFGDSPNDIAESSSPS
jgi:hypothetical protein